MSKIIILANRNNTALFITCYMLYIFLQGLAICEEDFHQFYLARAALILALLCILSIPCR